MFTFSRLFLTFFFLFIICVRYERLLCYYFSFSFSKLVLSIWTLIFIYNKHLDTNMIMMPFATMIWNSAIIVYYNYFCNIIAIIERKACDKRHPMGIFARIKIIVWLGDYRGLIKYINCKLLLINYFGQPISSEAQQHRYWLADWSFDTVQTC